MQIQISDQLNGIIKYAREEAMRTGSYGIGPDHLFLGIIRHEDNNAFQVLQGLGVEPAELKTFIDGRGAEVYYKGEPIGMFGEMAIDVVTGYEITHPVAFMELNLDPIINDRKGTMF